MSAGRDEVGELLNALYDGDWRAILVPGAADLLTLALLDRPLRVDVLPFLSSYAARSAGPLSPARLYAWQLAFDGDRWLDCVRIDVAHLRELPGSPEHHQVVAILTRLAPG